MWLSVISLAGKPVPGLLTILSFRVMHDLKLRSTTERIYCRYGMDDLKIKPVCRWCRMVLIPDVDETIMLELFKPGAVKEGFISCKETNLVKPKISEQVSRGKLLAKPGKEIDLTCPECNIRINLLFFTSYLYPVLLQAGNQEMAVVCCGNDIIQMLVLAQKDFLHCRAARRFVPNET
jgi:hypothetical protein